MLKLEDIRRVHVEITTRCNARCPMCMRNYRGSDYNSGYPITELTLEQFKHILTPDVLASIMQPDPPVNGRVPINYSFQGISFNGNVGDFAVSHDGVEIVEYLVENNVNVTINTNGSSRTPEWWARLASPRVEVGFALDGLADTHSLYRLDTSWDKITENAQALIAAGGNAVWRFVPFEHNRHQEDACRKLAANMGFSRFENIYDGRDNTPVFTRDGVYSHQIGIDTRPAHIIPEIKPMLENHITWYNKGTVKVEADVPNITYDCKHYRNREIYLAADGTVYPCCFLGFYPGQMHHPGNVELKELVMENNALEYSLEHCLQWFDHVESTWAKSSIAEGRTYQCVKTCGRQ
jgi:MoaA/NifB/PqqE/SkfB family radical SAM enzyme